MITEVVNCRSTLKSLSNFSESATLVLHPYQGWTTGLLTLIFHADLEANENEDEKFKLDLLISVQLLSVVLTSIFHEDLEANENQEEKCRSKTVFVAFVVEILNHSSFSFSSVLVQPFLFCFSTAFLHISENEPIRMNDFPVISSGLGMFFFHDK